MPWSSPSPAEGSSEGVDAWLPVGCEGMKKYGNRFGIDRGSYVGIYTYMVCIYIYIYRDPFLHHPLTQCHVRIGGPHMSLPSIFGAALFADMHRGLQGLQGKVQRVLSEFMITHPPEMLNPTYLKYAKSSVLRSEPWGLILESQARRLSLRPFKSRNPVKDLQCQNSAKDLRRVDAQVDVG